MPDPVFSVVNSTSFTLTAVKVADAAANGLKLAPGMTRLLTSTSESTIAPGATASIVLTGGAGGVLLAVSGSLMPLAGRLIDLAVTPSVTLTVSTTETDAMGHALDLVRNTMAAPTSKLAVDLVKALTDAGNAADDTAADAIMAAFFSSHPPYETVTQDGYAMMLSWVIGYAYLWGIDPEGRLGRRYDLQPAPYFGVNGTSLGAVTFAAPAGRSALAGLGDATSGLTITFTPAGGSAQTLTFANRSLGNGGTLLLLGTFCDPSWVATAGASTLLVPVFAGTLDGKTVIAVPATAGTADDGSASEGLSGLDIANLVISVIGLISSLVTIFMGVYAFKSYVANKRFKGENLGRRELAEARTSARETLKLFKEEFGDQLQRVGAKKPIVDDRDGYESDVEEMRPNSSPALGKVSKAKARKSISDSESEVEKLSKFSSNPLLNKVQSDLLSASQDLETDLPRAMENVGKATGGLKIVLTESEDSMSESEMKSSATVIEMTEFTSKVAAEIQKDKMEENEKGEQEESEEGLTSEED